MTRNTALDTLRSFALLQVLALHTYASHFFDNGYLGVTIFFVLSGFLITNLLQWSVEQGNSPHFRTFMKRRLHRLVPGMLTAAPIFLLAGIWLKAQHPWIDTAVAVSFSTDLSIMRGPTLGVHGVAAHTWTLTIEMLFYACWGATLPWALSRTNRARLAVMIAVTAAVATFYPLGVSLGLPYWKPAAFLYFDPLLRSGELLTGCLVAVLARKRRCGQGVTLTVLLCIILGALCIRPVTDLLHLSAYERLLPLATVVSGLLIWRLAAFNHERAPRRVVSLAAGLGRRSYEIYLVHLPAFALCQTFLKGVLIHIASLLLTAAVFLLHQVATDQLIRISQRSSVAAT